MRSCQTRQESVTRTGIEPNTPGVYLGAVLCLPIRVEEQNNKPPFYRIAKSVLPKDSSEEEIREAVANLHEFMMVAWQMYLRLESEGKFSGARKERKEGNK